MKHNQFEQRHGKPLVFRAANKGLNMKYCKAIVSILGFICLLNAAYAVPPWNAPTRYRGFTTCYTGNDRECLENLKVMKQNWKANNVRLMLRPNFISRVKRLPTFQDGWKMILNFLPQYLDLAKKLGVLVILDLHDVPYEKLKTYAAQNPKDSKARHRLTWADPKYYQTIVACWRDVARICKDRPEAIWFDTLNEPLNWNDMPSYPKRWPELAQELVNTIRAIDKRHAIMVEPGPGGICGGFKTFPLLKGKNIIYSVHQYVPHKYTHQGIGNLANTDLAKAYLQRQQPWPGKYGVMWNRDRIEKALGSVIAFQKRYKVRIYVGEFSAVRWAPNAAQYIADCIAIFEKYNWDWSYHGFRESSLWNVEHCDDFGPGKLSTVPTERAKVLMKYFKLNKNVSK